MKPSNENLRMLKPFFRGIPIIAVVMVAALAVAKRYLRYATPMYESTAKIRLADTKDGSPSSNLYKDFDVFVNQNKIGAELEMIKSRVLIEKALDSAGIDITTYRVGKLRKMELYKDCPFLVEARIQNPRLFDKTFHITIQHRATFQLKIPGSEKALTGQLGVPLALGTDTILLTKNEQLLQQRPELQLNDAYEFVINSREKLVDQVIANLSASSIDKEIPIIRLTYKSPVARKAADMVNLVAKTYIDDNVEIRNRSANSTVKFLNSQLDKVSSELHSSENAIESYRDKKRIINLRQETETDLRKIADMKVQQTNMRMNLEAITQLNDYIQSGQDITELAPNFEAYTDLLATELVKKMKLLQSEKKDLLVKYTPEHEQVKVIDAKLEDISKYLREGINNTRKNLEVKYGRISRDIVTAEAAFDGLPTKEKTLGILNRNFMLNEQTYNFLHAKRTEAEIAGAASLSFHRIISPGEIPGGPVSPNAGLLKILAGFLGFMGSILLIYLVHVMKGKVNDTVTIEKKSSVPVAATTPMLTKEKAVQVHFNKLSVQLEIKNFLQKGSVLAISSFRKAEGKSFNTYHLAAELANQQRNVLLVDADGKIKDKGIRSGKELFTCMDLTEPANRCVNSEALRNRLDLLRAQYDIVLIKNENISDASIGLMLMKLADANLFLFDSRITPARMVTEAQLLQEEYQFANIQYLLNRAGYNPNILVEALAIAKRIVRFLKNKFRK